MRIRAARLPPVLDLPSPASWSSLSAACLRVGAGGAALLPPLSANWPSLCSALWTTSTAAVPRRGQNILIRCEIRWVDAHFVDGVPAGSRRRVVFHGILPLGSLGFCLFRPWRLSFFWKFVPLLISSGDCRPLRAPTLCPLALTGTPPEPLSLGQPLPLSGVVSVEHEL